MATSYQRKGKEEQRDDVQDALEAYCRHPPVPPPSVVYLFSESDGIKLILNRLMEALTNTIGLR